MNITINHGSFQLPPAGIHCATFTKWVDEGEKPDPFNPGVMRRRLRLVWTIALPGGATVEQWDFLSPSGHIKSNLYKAIKALLGRTPAADESIDMDDLMGKKALITIEHYQNGKGQTRAKVASYTSLPPTNVHGPDPTDEDPPEFQHA